MPAPEPGTAVIGLPGGIRARMTWAGSGAGSAVFALSEAGGTMTDHGTIASPDVERLCRAELRVETPGGAWAVRLASRLFDVPRLLAWDEAGLIVVAYGFVTYGFATRTGELRWTHRSGTPIVAALGVPRLGHVIIQSEIDTFAIDGQGAVTWRVPHADVVTGAMLIGGGLAVSSYGGQVVMLDPKSGKTRG